LLSRANLRPAALLSTILALSIGLAAAGAARAHEVMPAIANMSEEGAELVFTVEAAVEAFVAGIDLRGLQDTNAAENAAAYDALRALPPEALEEAFRTAWPEIAADITVQAGGGALPLTLQSVAADGVGDVAVARSTVFVFAAALPPGGADSVQVGWDGRLGALVLRQQGVEAPYTGLLQNGALSEPIALSGGGAAGVLGAFMGYLPLGIDRIVPLGFQQMLVVLALFLLAPRAGPVAGQALAFALGLTVTLALGGLTGLTVPGAVLAPLLALALVYLGAETALRPGVLAPWRLPLVGAIGLGHGLVLAEGLAEIGLPDGAALPALAGYWAGLLIGLVAVLAAAFVLTAGARRAATLAAPDRVWAAVCLVLALVLVPLSLIPLGGLAEALAPVLAGCALLLGLSGAALARPGPDSYTRGLAVPTALTIAVIGAFWVVLPLSA